MRRLTLLTLTVGVAATGCEDGEDVLVIDDPSSTVVVENGTDDGPGSLRAALAAASADEAITAITVVGSVDAIEVSSSLTFTGSQALRIEGNGATLSGAGCSCDLLVARGGGSPTISDLTLDGGSNGLKVEVPEDRTGSFDVRLEGVEVRNSSASGIWIEEAADGGASLFVELASVTVESTGGGSSAPGAGAVRIDESGAGALTLVARSVSLLRNSRAGLTLTETGAGSVILDVQDSELDENGGDAASGDAGLQVDEADAGDIDLRFISTSADSNDGEGFQATESGSGNLRGSFSDVSAMGNGASNLSFTEDADAEGESVPGRGGLFVTLDGVTASESSEDGLRLIEYGAGDVNAQLRLVTLQNNDQDGIDVLQGGTGSGLIQLTAVTNDGNGGLAVNARGSAVTEAGEQGTTIHVRNARDAGFGSLRAALDAANESSVITAIRVDAGLEVVEIGSTLEFSGSQALTLVGNGATVDASECECDAFRASGDGDLIVEELTLTDGPRDGIRVTGGADLTLRSVTLRGFEGHGVLVDVPEDATGVVDVALDDVTIESNGLDGLYVDDLTGDFANNTGANSAAGVSLQVTSSTIRSNGFRSDVTDRGGIRIDEGGGGGIEVVAVSSDVVDNAGDGLLFTEKDLGDLFVEVRGGRIEQNGSQPQTPSEPEDGIDASEAGPGSLRIRMLGTLAGEGVSVLGNAGVGLDMDESGTGSVLLDAQSSAFDGNGEVEGQSGIRVREVSSGQVDLRLVSVSADGNGGAGMDVAESGEGDLRATLDDVTSTDNGGSNVVLTEDLDAEDDATPGAGGLFAILDRVTATGAADDGLRLVEFGAGDVDAQLRTVSLDGNGEDGIDLLQSGDGSGILHLAGVTTEGNGGLAVKVEGSAVTEAGDQGTTIQVRNAGDEGFGSFRAAVDAANESAAITTIRFMDGVGTIQVESVLEYTGDQTLLLLGGGATVAASGCGCEALLASGSGNLVVEELDLDGGDLDGVKVTGGGDLTLRNLAIRDFRGHGVLVDVPEAATGSVDVILDGATIESNGLHGVFVDDLTGDFANNTGANSAASISLTLISSTIAANGSRADVTDRGGVRIDEGGGGGIDVLAVSSEIRDNSADGMTLVEKGLGDVLVEVRGGRIDENGSQPQNPAEPGDGLDVSEAGPGSLRVRMLGPSVSDNFDRGIRLDEAGSGNLNVTLDQVIADGNQEENLTLTEDSDVRGDPQGGSGSVVFSFADLSVRGGGADGLVVEELGVGDLVGQMTASEVRNNADNAVVASQAGDGTGQLQLVEVEFSGNGADAVVSTGVTVVELPADEGGGAAP